MARALSHRNYRLFFAGQSVSLIGTWITRVATSWLVYRLTGSAALLGIVGFAGQIPVFVLSPFAGVWVDRLDRYRVLVATQVLAMAQSFALAALALTGVIEVWHILVLQAVQGVINAVDTPARQAAMVDMVEDRADLPNAIALNSTVVNSARLIGPSIAGVLIVWVGEGWCFLVDGISYAGVIASLLAMRMPRRTRPPRGASMRADLRAGFGYAFGFGPVRSALLLLAAGSLFGMPYTVLMPLIADRVLHGGAHTLGFLMGATGVGALAGAVYMASRATVLGLGRVIAISAAGFGLALVAFSFSDRLWISLLILVFAGLGFLVHLAATNTVLQTLVDEHMRGRTMAFYSMAFIGVAPFGSLWAGAVADRIGAPATIRIGGVLLVVAAGVFARGLPRMREQARPVYVERGILPEVAEGLEGAAALEQEMEP
ncbi:MAG: MFS transporter [Gemmatimonadetes bacterium]|nr:MFS transporter [Gemmatimonadota bacterium]